jgi:2-polyprenyl-3-methyl-5-hydroxy-6-metoxy-1,4-benzoquinol methylase
MLKINGNRWQQPEERRAHPRNRVRSVYNRVMSGMDQDLKISPQANTDATAEYFDAESGGWSERYRNSRHFRTRLETVLGWLQESPAGLSLLDYGCGSGVLLRELAMAGHQVTGVDVSEGMLAVAREAVKNAPQPVRLERVGPDFKGSYLDETYDGIISLGVIEYLENPYDLLEKLAVRIPPGGFLILSYPNQGSLLRWIEMLIFRNPEVFKRLGLFPGLTGTDSYLHHQKHRFSPERLGRFLQQHGLMPERTCYHVAPSLLGPLQYYPFFAMTAISRFKKT